MVKHAHMHVHLTDTHKSHVAFSFSFWHTVKWKISSTYFNCSSHNQFQIHKAISSNLKEAPVSSCHCYLSTTVTVVGQQWPGMMEHWNWIPRHQDWTSSWLDILCLIHLIRNKVKPVNLSAAIVHVKQSKNPREFSTITELWAFRKK